MEAQVAGESELEYYSVFYSLDQRYAEDCHHGCNAHFKLEPGVIPRVLEFSCAYHCDSDVSRVCRSALLCFIPYILRSFLALDTPPVASGNATSALEEFATLKPYQGTVENADLGSGRDLNLEAVIAANPDVIVTFKGHVDANYDELSKIAPVVQIDYGDTWENATMLCAQITGREKLLAEQLINETKESIAKAKEQLNGMKDKSFALLRVDGKANFTAQGTRIQYTKLKLRALAC